MTPWEATPEFTPSRIETLAKLLADVRAEVVDLHDEDLGDTNRSLGYRAYECCCSNILRKVSTEGFEWLGIISPTGRFTFSISNIPVRFWKGDPERLPGGKLIRSPEAAMQLELFDSSCATKDLVWYIVLRTDHTKQVERAFFIGYTDMGEIAVNWEIPLSSKITLLSEVNDVLPESVELESASSRVKTKKKSSIVVNNE